MNGYENADKKQQDIINQINDYNKEEIGDVSGETDSESPEIPDENKNEIGGAAGEGENPIVDEYGLAKEDTTIVAKDDPNVQIVIPKGFAPAILETGRTDSSPEENGTVEKIMPAEDWNNITAEQINKGIVVVDHAITYTNGTGYPLIIPDFNEYVWIPIKDESKFARIAWNTPNTGEHILSEEKPEDGFWEDKTTQEYRDMVDSVIKNKGFYISRYEASKKDSITAQSKSGQIPWGNEPYSTFITASNNMKPSIHSHLIYGIEWDSILQWFLDSRAIVIGAKWTGTSYEYEIDIMSREYIESQSYGFGNYEGGSYNTGVKEEYKVNNIYDLAGNLEEATQEEIVTMLGNISMTQIVSRGGNWKDKSPIAERTATSTYNNNYCGFRVAFYV